MSEFEPNNSQPGLSVQEDAAKTNALIAYGLMAAGLFTGIFWFVGAFWGMIKASEARGTRFEDHFKNISTIFWWGLLFTIIGFITLFFIVGYFILIGVWIWSVFKLVKGIANITSNRSYYP